MNQKSITDLIYGVGALLTIAGAILYFFEIEISKYIFTSGVIGIVGVHGWIAYHIAGTMRQQRLARIGFTASLVLAIGVYFMFTHSNSWVVTLMIYALITFFLTLRNDSTK